MGGMPSMGMLDTARAHFPELIAYTLCFGAPLGLALGTWGLFQTELQAKSRQEPFSWPRALVVGGLAGVFGGWAFGKWMAQVNFFPLIAGLVNSTRPSRARLRGSHVHQRVDRNELRPAVSPRIARFRIGRGMGPGLWIDLVVCRAADLDANLARRDFHMDDRSRRSFIAVADRPSDLWRGNGGCLLGVGTASRRLVADRSANRGA